MHIHRPIPEDQPLSQRWIDCLRPDQRAAVEADAVLLAAYGRAIHRRINAINETCHPGYWSGMPRAMPFVPWATAFAEAWAEVEAARAQAEAA